MSATKDSGFTLVEALVSLFVFSLIASGCVIMLMQSVDSEKRVGEAHQALRELQTMRALLNGDLSQAVSRERRGPSGEPLPAFIGGDADAPLLVTRASAEPSPEGAPAFALALVRYRFVGRDVVRIASTDTAGLAGEDVGRVVLSNVENPRFQFFDGVRWLDNWVTPPGGALPRAVALVADTPRYGEVRIQALVGLGW